jgi:HNH endonuclease
MSVPVRVRFEVFKRDRFTCSYCGNHPPDVLLEVDHVTPRAAGGTDDEDNLVTACWDCNRGKSDRLLNEGTRPINRQAVEDITERVAQAEAYAQAVARLREIEGAQSWRVTEAWALAFHAQATEKAEHVQYELLWSGERFPSEASVRLFLGKLPLSRVLEAVDITASRFEHARDGADRYFYAICWRMVNDSTGGHR